MKGEKGGCQEEVVHGVEIDAADGGDDEQQKEEEKQ
jgi:hypothetical protein